MWQAIEELASSVMDRETEYDAEKLAEKMRAYFRRGSKNMNLKSGEPWEKLVNEFADNIFTTVYTALGDREWLKDVDFQLCFDLAVQETFPGRVLKNVSPDEYMEVSMAAADRAIDEQRYGMARWETVSSNIEGKNTIKRVSHAVDEARGLARAKGAASAEEFMRSWINFTCQKMAESIGGDPSDVIEEEKAVQLFNALVQDNCMPLVLVEDGLPEDGWDVIADAVSKAYSKAAGGKMNAVMGAISRAKTGGRQTGGLLKPSMRPSMAAPAARGGGGFKWGAGGDDQWQGGGGAAWGSSRLQVQAPQVRRGIFPVDQGPAKRFRGGW